MKLASNTSWSSGSASGCLNTWDLEAVATHEFGHWIGQRNLGNGDLSGMLSLYGKN